MQHPIEVIQRVCQRKNVNPVWLLAILLDILRQNHQMLGLPLQGKQQKTTVFDEVASTIQMMQRQDDPPSSVLAWLDLTLQVHQLMDTENTKVYQKANRTDEAENLRQKALAEETLRLIIREVMNESEKEGLAQAMALEASWKKHDEEDRKKREQEGGPDGPATKP